MKQNSKQSQNNKTKSQSMTFMIAVMLKKKRNILKIWKT